MDYLDFFYNCIKKLHNKIILMIKTVNKDQYQVKKCNISNVKTCLKSKFKFSEI